MNAQSLLWFGISGGAAIFAASLLHARYIKRDPRAVRSRGSYTMFAFLMLFFAAAALAAGLVSLL